MPDPLKQATFGAVYVVYDDDAWLSQSYSSIYLECDYILFLVANRPWHGPWHSTEATINTIDALPDPADKTRVIRGQWYSETEQRNAGLQQLQELNVDYCLVVDADEVYDSLQLKRMMIFAACVPAVDVWHIQMVTYWKSPLFRIEPPERFQPPVLLKNSSAYFVEHRNAAGIKHASIPPHVAVLHHLSYARNDQDILRKIQSFSHAAEVAPDWYERVWKGWDNDPNMVNLNPAYPVAYHKAVKQDLESLPMVLRECLED